MGTFPRRKALIGIRSHTTALLKRKAPIGIYMRAFMGIKAPIWSAYGSFYKIEKLPQGTYRSFSYLECSHRSSLQKHLKNALVYTGAPAFGAFTKCSKSIKRNAPKSFFCCSGSTYWKPWKGVATVQVEGLEWP